MQPSIHARHLLWCLAGLLAMFIGAVVGGMALGLYFQTPGAITVGVSLGGALLGVTVLLCGLGAKCGWRLYDFGFRHSAHSLWHLSWWIPVTIVSAVTILAVTTLLLGIEPSGSTENKSEALSLGWEAGIAIFGSTALFIPLMEEIIFRRVLLDWLLAKVPTPTAGIIVILIFVAIHLVSAVIVYALVLGLSTVAARLWFKTLTAPLLIHSVNNALVTAIALLALA